MIDRESQLSPEAGEATADFSEWARQCCFLARRHEDAGDYETARRIISPFWQRTGERPKLDGLSEAARAEVLLRTGSLTGWIGSARRLEGAQEFAKDLISESVSLFERLRLPDKVAEALTSLATCYWRMGAFDEARDLLRGTCERLGEQASELKARALILTAVVENSAGRPRDALAILNGAASLFDGLDDHALKGRFHATLANSLQRLGSAENRTDYADRALVEYAAASFQYEQAGHARYLATVENNVGFLFFTLGKFEEAHEHLDRAHSLLAGLGDGLRAAQVVETRARTLLAQGRNVEAERAACEAASVFEQAEEYALLSEALRTRGAALARLKRIEEARADFLRALDVAERAGSLEHAGLASLSLLEELGAQLSADERRAARRSARGLLERSQQPEVLGRLRRALDSDEGEPAGAGQPHSAEGRDTPAEIAIENFVAEARVRHRKQVVFTEEAVGAMRHHFVSDGLRQLRELIDRSVEAAGAEAVIDADAVETVSLRRTPEGDFAQPWAGFSLKEETRLIEKRFIELALKEAGGRVSLAAKLLGFNHPGLLNSVIKSRHPELLEKRTPLVPRVRRGQEAEAKSQSPKKN